MEKTRKTKVIALLALVVAVVGMSLGFAAFSNILTISSSATVTPNDEDFKMKIYGFVDPTGIEDIPNIMSYVSDVTAKPFVENAELATDAVIDNTNLTVSNLTASLTRDARFVYYFMIENVGQYDAYIKLYDYNDTVFSGGNHPKKCEATSTDATVELVNEACKSIKLSADSAVLRAGATEIETIDEKYAIDTPLKLEPGDRLLFFIDIYYDYHGSLADGEFTVTFDEIKFEFNTRA